MREPTLYVSGGTRKGVLLISVPCGYDRNSLSLYTCGLPGQGQGGLIPIEWGYMRSPTLSRENPHTLRGSTIKTEIEYARAWAYEQADGGSLAFL